MKRWEKIVFAVSGGLIGLGAVCACIGVAMGGSLNYSIRLGRGYSDRAAMQQAEPQTVEIADSFQQISMTAESADIQIVKTDDAQPRLESLAGSGTVQWSVEDGTLNICQRSNDSGLGINFDFWFWKGAEQTAGSNGAMVLYLPEDHDVSAIRVSASYGEVGVSGIRCEELDITAESDAVSLAALDCDILNLTTEYGDVHLEDSSVRTLTGKAESGDVKVQNVQVDELELRLEYGSLDWEGGLIANGDISIDSGDSCLRQTEVSSYLYMVSCYGTISFESAQDVDSYNYHLNSDFGAIQVEDQSYENSTTYYGAGNTASLDFYTEDGDIILN